MSALNLPITALRFAGQGLGLAGKGAMGAAKFGGRTLVRPGMIGSLARWMAASMVLSSLPNPAARKQAIDKALHEANRVTEREYISLREDMKRNNQLRKRQREFDSTQRILDSNFLANPEERNFERRMAEISKKYDETLQKIEEVSLQRQQDLEESQRIMESRRDVGFWARTGEDVKNVGKGVYNTGVGAVQGAAGMIDLLTFGATNLHGKNADWEKRMSAKEMTMVVPKEWTDKYGQMENKDVNLSDNAGYKIVDGMVRAWGKHRKKSKNFARGWRKTTLMQCKSKPKNGWRRKEDTLKCSTQWKRRQRNDQKQTGQRGCQGKRNRQQCCGEGKGSRSGC